jgi:hypothetical protein
MESGIICFSDTPAQFFRFYNIAILSQDLNRDMTKVAAEPPEGGSGDNHQL